MTTGNDYQDGWVKNTGKQPVNDWVLIHVVMRDGYEEADIAGNFGWEIHEEIAPDAVVDRWRLHEAVGWADISTAPRDGRWIILAGKTSRTDAGRMICRWNGVSWESADDGYGAYITPTHWRYLDPSPVIG